jgi:hypothetical protein
MVSTDIYMHYNVYFKYDKTILTFEMKVQWMLSSSKLQDHMNVSVMKLG